MIKNNIKFCFVIISFFLLSSCGSAQSGYPILLTEGKQVNPEYTTFNLEARTFANREMISIGLDLEGNTICYDRKSKSRLCSQDLRTSRPEYKLPKELIFDPDVKYSDEEIKEQNAKTLVWLAKNYKRKREAWDDIVEKQPLLELEVFAVDSNNQEIPFVWAGEGSGYCASEKDQSCNQYRLDEKNSKIKTLEGVTLKAVKIKSVEGELKVSNIYVVGPYRRD
jgi:hypothetical protein